MVRPTPSSRESSPMRPVWLALFGLAVLLVSACGGSSSSPQTTLSHYLDAWSRGDWVAMRSQVLDPPGGFTSVNSQAFGALGISRASFAAGRITMARSGDSASAQVSEHFTLPHVGSWATTTTVRM